MCDNWNMNSLVSCLTNSSTKVVYKALITLRTKVLKQNCDSQVRNFRQKGGLKNLLPLIGKPNGHIANVALSILGNCCLENECRQEVKRLNGISALVTVLKCLDSESIQNRVCRSLANLALDMQICIMIHEEGAVPLIVRLLRSCKDSGCQQSAIRALRILSRTIQQRDKIVVNDGVEAISALLSAEDENLLIVVLRALAHLTRQCTPECAQQVQTGEGLQTLVSICSNKNCTLQREAICILNNLVHQPGLRPAMGNAGAVDVFIHNVDKCINGKNEDFANCLTSLCLSCREAINRVRVRDGGGLKTLITLLSSKNHVKYHPEIISALLNFVYDETSLDVLLEMDLGTLLVDKLASYIEEYRKDNGDEMAFHDLDDPIEDKKSPLPSCSNFSDFQKTDKSKLFIDCQTSERASLKRKEPEDRATSPSGSEVKIRRTYHINSPSYQEVQNESLVIWSPVDDKDQWSPTNTIYSPVQSPPDWNAVSKQSQALASTTFNMNSFQSSPGGMSPDWFLNDRGFGGRRGSDDDWCTKGNSQCSSPLTISPVDSPRPQYACYSPVCEDYSEPEESPAHNMNVAERHELPDHNMETPSTSNSAVVSEQEDSLEVEMEVNSPKAGCFDEIFINSKSINAFWESLEPGPPYINHLLMILSRISQMEKPNIALLSATAIDSLIAMVAISHTSRATRILFRLIRNPLCLESLINLRLPQTIHSKLVKSRHSSDDCLVCCNFRKLGNSLSLNMCFQAESPYGIGVINHMMTAGNDIEKLSSAFTIPYVIGLTTFRQKITVIRKALDIICNVLLVPSSSDFPVAVRSVMKMCENLKPNLVSAIYQSKFERQPEGSCVFDDECKDSKDVTFILDDGETVTANRTILIQSSSVFCAMFGGGFVEATQECVRFREATKPIFEFVIHFLYECSAVGTTPCPVIHNADVYLLLEVAVLADRLLLCKLQNHLHDRIVKLISPSNAADVYIYAENHNFTQIAESVLNCIFRLKFEMDEGVEFLTDVLNTDLNSKLISDMKRIITVNL